MHHQRSKEQSTHTTMAAAEIDHYAIAAQLFPNLPQGFPLDRDAFDLRQIPLPPDDDEYGIHSSDDKEGDDGVKAESGFGSVIGARCSSGMPPPPPDTFGAVVANLPQVPPEKAEKLSTIIRKIYAQIGTIREGEDPCLRSTFTMCMHSPCTHDLTISIPDTHAGGLYMPMDEKTQTTKGFAFIEFSSSQEAVAAREQTNGYPLDKKHTFVVSMFDDFEKYQKVPDQYQLPEPKAFQTAVSEDE